MQHKDKDNHIIGKTIIDRCPYCQEPIKFNIVKKINAIHDYGYLLNRLNVLYDLYDFNTSSQGKEKIMKKIYETEKEIAISNALILNKQ